MNLALFDFDGTITKKDSFEDFIDFVRQKHKLIILKSIPLIPIAILHGIGLIPMGRFVEIFMTFFFKGWKKTYFDELAISYANTKLSKIVRHEALEEINKHKSNGDKIVIVTASFDSWLSGWCQENETELICSHMEIKDGLITGKLRGEYCNGVGKVKLIQERFDLDNYEKVYAYGDSSGDIPMLELADIAYYRWKKQE